MQMKKVVSIRRNHFSKRDVLLAPATPESLMAAMTDGIVVDRLDGGVFEVVVVEMPDGDRTVVILGVNGTGFEIQRCYW